MNQESININLKLSEIALEKIKKITIKYPNSKFRIFITGGGCNGFQYGFTIDKKIHDDDILIFKFGVSIIIDPMSFQYLNGGLIDYTCGLHGSKFIVINPNAKTTCSCGYSFSV
ncbi:MAG: iron-sulfur cluster insertion protein ErpA [Enterobacterales bacterium]